MSGPPAWAARLRNERLRKSPRWSQLRAATALQEKAHEFRLAVPSRESLLRMLKGWERGDHQPSDFYRALWALVYDVPERALFAELPPSAMSVLGLGLVAVESNSGLGGDSVRRRDVLLSGSVLGSLAFTGPSRQFRVGTSEVREVASAARSLHGWDRRFGGWVPYQAATGYVDSAMRLVRGTYSEKTAARLLPAVADLCDVAGWIAYDIGRSDESLRYFSLGVQVAQQGQDQGLAARLLCDMARVNADLGNPMQSVELLGLARHLAQARLPATVLAKLHSMEAKTYAILGRVAECERAIGHAERQMEHGPTDDEPVWIGYFDESQLAGVIGSCYRDLSVHHLRYGMKAETRIGCAVAKRDSQQVRNRALDHVNLATVRLRRGEVDGMVEAAREAVRIAEALRSHRVNSRLRALARGSIEQGHCQRMVQELRHRIGELSAAGA